MYVFLHWHLYILQALEKIGCSTVLATKCLKSESEVQNIIKNKNKEKKEKHKLESNRGSRKTKKLNLGLMGYSMDNSIKWRKGIMDTTNQILYHRNQ